MRTSTLFRTAMLCLSLLFVSQAAQSEDITDKLGYVEFAKLDKIYGEPTVLINLNKTMLGFVSKLNVSDKDTSELISNLDAVLVNIYDMKGNTQPALELISSVSKDIQSKGWMPIVSINEEYEKVRIFTKITNETMDGLVVMIIDNDQKGEAVFINIIGQIDPEKINQVTDSLNLNIDLD